MPTERERGAVPDRTHPGPDKLSIIVFSGEFTKVHSALVLASAAAAVGRPATLFFTMAAAAFLTATDANGSSGWRQRPSMSGHGKSEQETAGAIDDAYGDRGVATFEELLAACVDLGVRFMVCEMGLRAMSLQREHLRSDVIIQEGGVVTFLADASSAGAVLFI